MSRGAAVARLLAFELGGAPTVDAVRAEFAALGASPSDDALDSFATALATCWATGPRPILLAPRDEWLRMWSVVGYVHSGLRMPERRPARALTLYRAATTEHAHGMSWTPRRDVAELYRDEHRAIGERSHVWEARIDPAWLLATFPQKRVEHVVDMPAEAEIRRLPSPKRLTSTVAAMRETWGRSAAGVIVRDRDRVLLQLRSSHVQYPGTWSIPGGAVERGETAADAALRELAEEAGLSRRDVRLPDRVHVAEPVAGWRYSTIVAKLRKSARDRATPPPSAEAARHEWVPIDDVAALSLHPGFASSWPEVRALLRRPFRVVFVCAGNICRSPMAELLLRRMAEEAGVALEVRSSGVKAEPGAPMDADSAAVAERYGLDPSGHRARVRRRRRRVGRSRRAPRA